MVENHWPVSGLQWTLNSCPSAAPCLLLWLAPWLATVGQVLLALHPSLCFWESGHEDFLPPNNSKGKAKVRFTEGPVLTIGALCPHNHLPWVRPKLVQTGCRFLESPAMPDCTGCHFGLVLAAFQLHMSAPHENVPRPGFE